MIARLRAGCQTLRCRPRSVLVLWSVGAVVILTSAVALSDPALLMFVLDPELVAVLVLGSWTLFRASTAALALRVVAPVERARSWLQSHR
jgi:hypothetical protein